jgi:hypothetical protein
MVDVGVSPMLDIGDDVGALVLYLDDVPASGEIELCPVDDPAGRFHTGVHQRQIGGRLTMVAVFPAVRAGMYHVLDTVGRPMLAVEVSGSSVQELDLRHATMA